MLNFEARIYNTDGTFEDVLPEDGVSFKYEKLREIVSGIVEIVPLNEEYELVRHEEGKLLGFEKNKLASDIWNDCYPIDKYALNNDQTVVGRVLICKGKYLL